MSGEAGASTGQLRHIAMRVGKRFTRLRPGFIQD
jgi:hypothetical protein